MRQNKRNDDRYYYCSRLRHIRQNCLELKRMNSCRGINSKSLGAWSDEEGFKEDLAETAHICFMTLGEISEVRIPNCPNCYDLQNTIDMVADELQKVFD